MYRLLFFLFALSAVGCGIHFLLQRDPLKSAVSLIGVFAALASLYVMLGAELLAAVQVILCAGAVMVLSIFVMVALQTRAYRGTGKSAMARNLGAPLTIMLLGMLTSLFYRIYPPDTGVRFGDFPAQTADIGRHLYLYYMLPFELVSILILVGILGAVLLAQKEL